MVDAIQPSALDELTTIVDDDAFIVSRDGETLQRVNLETVIAATTAQNAFDAMPGKSVSAQTKQLRTDEYATGSLIGGAYYKRVQADPVYASGAFRTQDRFLPDGTVDATNGGWWRLNETFIDITRLGCRPGGDVAHRLNEAMRNEAPGTRFWIPGTTADAPWWVEEPIRQPSGAILDGFGWTLNNDGSILKRSPAADYHLIEWIGDPTQPEHDPFRYVNNTELRNIYLNGGGADHDVMQMSYAGVCAINRCVFSHNGSRTVEKRLLHIIGQSQDSWISDTYFYNGGAFDGSMASVDIDDSEASQIGHNQHIRFRYCTHEAFNGTALYVHGVGAPPASPIGNTIMVWDNCKFEAVTRSVQPYLVFDRARSIVLNNIGVYSNGPNPLQFPERYPTEDTNYVIPELIKISNGSRIKLSATMLKQQNPHVTLDHLITLNNVQSIDIEIKAADALTINDLNHDYLIQTTGLTGVSAKTSFRGAKNLCNYEIPAVFDQSRLVVSHTSALAAEISRLDPATGEIINANRAFKFVGAALDGSEDMFFGVNAVGEFCVSLVADLSQYKFKIGRDGQPYIKSNTINMLADGNAMLITSGVGSPEGAVAAHVGSLYMRVDGYAGHALYVKETGAATVDTGWAAK